ncbi:MAG: hypothetical protein QOD72_1153, partial [Acidimicrobiaceae bacterium]|nr:hypothetical protein [Acidimicrobiaceae bacterium]
MWVSPGAARLASAAGGCAMREAVVRLGDGRRVGYAEYGDPDGWPILMFHGL